MTRLLALAALVVLLGGCRLCPYDSDPSVYSRCSGGVCIR